MCATRKAGWKAANLESNEAEGCLSRPSWGSVCSDGKCDTGARVEGQLGGTCEVEHHLHNLLGTLPRSITGTVLLLMLLVVDGLLALSALSSPAVASMSGHS